MAKHTRQIGTNEFISIFGSPEKIESVFYIRYFQGRKIKEVTKLENFDEIWTAILPNGKTKTFLTDYLKVLFSD